MILSHTFKYICPKPKKVAGTSVKIALAKHCSRQDLVVNRFSEEEIDQRPWLKTLNASSVLKLDDINLGSKWYQRRKSKKANQKDPLRVGVHITSQKLKKIIKTNKNTFMTAFKSIFTLKTFKAEEIGLKKRELT